MWCWRPTQIGPYQCTYEDVVSVAGEMKHNRSLAADGADVDSITHDLGAQCGAGGQPASPKAKGDLMNTHTRLWYRLQARGWSEPVDLPLLLSQTKYNRSLTAIEAGVDSATHDMVVQCGAGDQPKGDLLSTHTRLWYRS
jgi:hypothetical protein